MGLLIDDAGYVQAFPEATGAPVVPVVQIDVKTETERKQTKAIAAGMAGAAVGSLIFLVWAIYNAVPWWGYLLGLLIVPILFYQITAYTTFALVK